MVSQWSAADALVARVLMVKPTPRVSAATGPTSADRLMSIAVVVSAVRCTISYVLVPLVLPLIGILAGATRGVTLACDVVAVVAVVASLRRFWRAQHPQRWRYLLVAVGVLLVAGLFLGFDLSLIPTRTV
jgi:hypothetical protein